MARYYWQPNPVLAREIDSRQPVLYLRSFLDDELPHAGHPAGAFLDFSLENRLAAHFGSIGPFFALAAPGDNQPRIGAIRAALDDRSWRGSVLDLMAESQWILVVAGSTDWLGWEFRRVVAMGHLPKVIVLFPEKAAREDPLLLASRLATVRDALSDTAWARALENLPDAASLRAIAFLPDGAAAIVTSSARNRESYVLGAMLAQWFLQTSWERGKLSTRETIFCGECGAKMAVWRVRCPSCGEFSWNADM
ncbi:MAG: hypothetical protein JST93_30380 [Acidobacteria bacterium]|nr:hypothetical protein [Acidobacteriota bacterium]